MRPPNSPLTELFRGCVYSKNPLDRAVPRTPGDASSASLPQPTDIATIYSPSSTSSTSDRRVCTTAPRVRLNASPPLSGLEDQAPLSSSRGIPVEAAPVLPRWQTSTSAPSLQPHVGTTQVGTYADRSSATLQKECKYRPSGNPPCHRPRPTCWTWSFPPSHGLWSCIWSVLDKPNQLDLVTLTMQTATSCIIHIATPFCNGIQDQRAESHTGHCRHLRTILRSHLTRSQ